MFAKKLLILAFALVALSAEEPAEEEAAVAETAEAIVDGAVATEADAEAIDCATEESTTCVDTWVAGGCMPEAPEGCDAYEGCAMEALAAGSCGADCQNAVAMECEAEWIEKGCTQDSAILGEEFIAKCDEFKACGMLTMTQGRCPEGAALEEACAAEEKACMDDEACKSQFDDSMSTCLGGSEDSAQFADCMSEAMNAEKFPAELQQIVTDWSACVAAMEEEMAALCGEEAAVACVATWTDAGCPADFEPSEDCMQYEACALGAMDEGACPAAEEGAAEEVAEPAEEETAAQDAEAEPEQAETEEEAAEEPAAEAAAEDCCLDESCEDMSACATEEAAPAVDAEAAPAAEEGAEDAASAGIAGAAFAALFAFAL